MTMYNIIHVVGGSQQFVPLTPEEEAAYNAALLPNEIAFKRAAINAERDRLEISGFSYLGKTFDSDQRSTDRIQVAALAAQAALMAAQPFSIDWTAADNTVVTLDAAGMIGLATAFAQYGASLHAHAKTLKAQVDAATTVAEVQAIATW